MMLKRDRELLELMKKYQHAVDAGSRHGWQEKLQMTDSGEIKATLANLILIFENDERVKSLIAFNNFAEKLIIKTPLPEAQISKGDWSDEYLATLRAFLTKEYTAFTRNDLFDVIMARAYQAPFNPLHERIESATWDQKPRVASLFIDTLGAEDSDYIKQLTTKWLVGLVARAYQAGCKFEIVPVLTGKQGIGKSTLAKRLAGREFFADDLPSMKTKDDTLLLLGNWLIELSELSAMRKTDIESTKRFISTTTDKCRKPYARTTSELPRTCGFIATTNDAEFLLDYSGNRRLFPVPCGCRQPTVDVFAVDDDYFLQVIAEAKHLYDNGTPWFTDRQFLKLAEPAQEHAKEADPFIDTLHHYLNQEVPENYYHLAIDDRRDVLTDPDLFKDGPHQKLYKTSVEEILRVVFGYESKDLIGGRTGSIYKRIRLIMDNHPDFERKAIKLNGNTIRGYYRMN